MTNTGQVATYLDILQTRIHGHVMNFMNTLYLLSTNIFVFDFALPGQRIVASVVPDCNQLNTPI